MELYGQQSKSIPQKTVIILAEVLLLLLSYYLLFQNGTQYLFEFVGLATTAGNMGSRILIFSFSIIVFLRMTFMMLYLLKRKIPWEEAFSVPFAFSLYFVGFSLLGFNRTHALDWFDAFAVLLFVVGSVLNTGGELLRHFWKQKPENKGKIYTEGFFKYSMHINYFGDLLWVIAYAIVTLNIYAAAIPVMLFCLFAFWNIPILDKYLAEKYKAQFDAYSASTKKFIPFIW